MLSQFTVKWKYREGFFSDKRVKLISDAVNGIRTIKAYAWEIPYKKIIIKWRKSQLGMLLRNHFINAIGSGVFMNGGFLIAVVMFTYHWGMDREFSYSKSLSTIALLSYLSLFAIFFLYNAISNFSTFCAIMFRVGEILKMDEFSSPPGLNDESLEPGTRIMLDNASVTWGFNIQKSKDKKEIKEDIEDVNLHSISFDAKDGELITIVGAVGCGKSTMLHALMHELKITEGSIRTNGTRAYVEQEPFIMSGTLKENILVGGEFDPKRFDEVTKACCLDHDIANLPQGAETEIGERGVTVSGGQKARISLARAVYSDADIYFLDDPLSAVDPDVASKIFKNCINGYLKDKCRVLVTHQVQYLKKVETILFLEENTIKYRGSYSDLKDQGLDFDEILKAYEKKEEKKPEDEIDVDLIVEDEEEESEQSTVVVKDKMTSKVSIKEKPETIEKPQGSQGLIVKEIKQKGGVTIRDCFKFASYGIGWIGIVSFLFLSLI